ncbi:hypothetical protein UFOVP398_61 [uncultured Caudovirales phage]|uniref:Uncharacterized protein n=1 Tax=uncultured Caudovirales phage TaxID=2100421 RepID=A0A6J5M1L7_9CAUD|nr:hypothetical protein UFOVP398_61 [uncultured Caudovirales phage]
MTPTELIAVKLFGWERVEPERDDPTAYEHPTGSTAYVGGELDGTGYGPIGGADWPDLADLNDIRRMEDALAERGLISLYVAAIEIIVPITPDYDQNLCWREWRILRATAEQRVAAAVKVLEGVK